MSAVDELRAQLAGDRLLVDVDVVDAYRRDEARLVVPGAPLGVVLAHDAADVQVTLR